MAVHARQCALRTGKDQGGEEADRVFAQAGEKCQAALQIKPDSHEALNNWGTALFEQAKTKDGEEADRLFAQAGEKHQAALQIKPDMHETLNNWGNVLLAELTKAGRGDDNPDLSTKTEDILFKAERIRPGSGAYNLACLYALQNREAECHEWLEKSYQHGTLPKREHLEG